MTLSRRSLFRATAGLSVAFALGRPAMAGPKSLATDAVDAFLSIAPDGAVTIYAGKVDLGTGARIALPQIVADELGAELARIRLIEGDTALTPDQGGTGGSTGIPVGAMQIRQAAATAREKLIALAALKLGVPPETLQAIDGEVRPRTGGPGVAFAALLEGQDFALGVDPKARLKSPSAFRFIGKPLPRPDVTAKFTATHTYVHDIRRPGMLHGRVIRPPSLGAQLLSVDEASVAGIPGVRVVRIKNFLGVVAPGEWNAVRASRRLKAVWREAPPPGGSDTLFQDVRASEVVREEVMRADSIRSEVVAHPDRLLRATYEWPIQSHGSMGPSCAVADVGPDTATIWSASQGTHRMRRIVAGFLGLDPARVRVIFVDGAGSYGTNGNDDAAADAALLSRAVAAPVRVQWSRADEHGWDPKGPPHVLDLSAGLDPQGGLAAWETVAFLPMNTPGLPGIPLLAVGDAGLAQAQGLSSGLLSGNADPPYRIPTVRATIKWLKNTPLRPSNLRAPGKIANVFAVESFFDEVAAALVATRWSFGFRG